MEETLETSPLGALPQDQSVVNVTGSRWFAALLLTIIALGWMLAGLFPLQLSMTAVFLFAAPHNWLEARVFLERMPPRWGRLKFYYWTSLLGVVLLTVAFIGVALLTQLTDFNSQVWHAAMLTWNLALVSWIGILLVLRAEENPHWQAEKIALAATPLVALACLWPALFGLMLVYLHPLIAFLFLDVELRRKRPDWLRAYRWGMVVVVVALLLLVVQLCNSSPLRINDLMTAEITRHSGANILPWINNRVLVGTHAFLELLHYGVWLIAIPLVSLRAVPWRLNAIPLARHSRFWQAAIGVLLVVGLLSVGLFWCGFLLNYTLTRNLYFTLAIFHVLAEAPFLLRAIR